jgi:hypothetical protein
VQDDTGDHRDPVYTAIKRRRPLAATFGTSDFFAPPDDRLSDLLLDLLRDEGDLYVGDNEPYAGTCPAIPTAMPANGRANALIEIAQQLTPDHRRQTDWPHPDPKPQSRVTMPDFTRKPNRTRSCRVSAVAKHLMKTVRMRCKTSISDEFGGFCRNCLTAGTSCRRPALK